MIRATPTYVEIRGYHPVIDEHRKALCAWCEQHGLDPLRMLLTSPIIRGEEPRTVLAEYLSEPGSPWGSGNPLRELHRVQLEAPPLPWPAVIRALYEGRP